MAKKKKKAILKQKTAVKPKSNIKTVICVDCPKEPFGVVKMEECKACQYRMQDSCHFTIPKTDLQIVSASTPMKFNRVFFQASSQEIADSTRNYYIHVTDIMKEVRAIPGYPNYSKVKARFLAGEYKRKEEEKSRRRVTKINPVLFLSLSTNGKEPDMIIEGNHYQRSEPFTLAGEWEILCYLYDLVGLEGFSDIQVKGRWYKVRLNPIETSKESLVLAKQNDKLVLGSIS